MRPRGHRKGHHHNLHSNCGLAMECTEDDLTLSQTQISKDEQKEYDDVLKQLNLLKKDGEIIVKGDKSYIVQRVTSTTVSTSTVTTPTTTVTKAITQPTLSQLQRSLIPTATKQANKPGGTANSIPGQYHLLMDPNTGFIVLPPPNTIATVSQGAQSIVAAKTVTVPSGLPPRLSTSTVMANRMPIPSISPRVITTIPNRAIRPTQPVVIARTQISAARPPPPSKPPILKKPIQPKQPSPAVQTVRSPNMTTTNARSALQGSKPVPVVDLTQGDDGLVEGDPKIVTTPRPEGAQGKTFPSLVVLVKPCLQETKNKQIAAAERNKLDGKVKTVLVFTPTRFTEWLIQQGLVRSEQICKIHVTPQHQQFKFKLGMYSDGSRFPYSGGYVWISDCCKNRMVSVFNGSIFEGAPYPPTILLKLIYHWSVQTTVTNVIQWVKVDNYYIKNFYAFMRSICVAGVQEKFGKMGRANKCIEVGVISLGTTSQDGSQRQVKVEVLGALDMENHLIRLRAVEPPNDTDRNSKTRFSKILSPLTEWVNNTAIIATDFTVDKDVLHNLGYPNVVQVSPTNTDAKYTNNNVMSYLRRVVPRMFQNTLSLLSRGLIQQFLDELVWRERWGGVASAAFDNIVEHLADLTKLDTGESLLTHLNKIAANPFVNSWSTNIQKPKAANMTDINKNISQANNTANVAARTARMKRPNSEDNGPVAKLPKVDNAMLLEQYYYGMKDGNGTVGNAARFDSMKCPHCAKYILSSKEAILHMALHLEQPTMPFVTQHTFQCIYCLKDMKSKELLNAHIDDTHVKSKMSQLCRICEDPFRKANLLIAHMHKQHLAKELPYVCVVCDFRASFHYVVIDHFYQKHIDIDVCQCPFCLKSLSLKSTCALTMISQHLQKHKTRYRPNKCKGCILDFHTDSLLKEHVTKHHMSLDGIPGVKELVVKGAPTGPLVMPAPRGKIQQNFGRAAPASRSLQSFMVQDIGDVVLKNMEINKEKCHECNNYITSPSHFSGYFCCQKCRFCTCCRMSMQNHTKIFHNSEKLIYDMGKLVELENPMFCFCGFSTTSGNKLANHLMKCECKSAYTSMENADKDSKDVIIDDDVASYQLPLTGSKQQTTPTLENESKLVKSDAEVPNMLGMLGLVRRPIALPNGNPTKSVKIVNKPPEVVVSDDEVIVVEESSPKDPIEHSQEMDDDADLLVCLEPEVTINDEGESENTSTNEEDKLLQETESEKNIEKAKDMADNMEKNIVEVEDITEKEGEEESRKEGSSENEVEETSETMSEATSEKEVEKTPEKEMAMEVQETDKEELLSEKVVEETLEKEVEETLEKDVEETQEKEVEEELENEMAETLEKDTLEMTKETEKERDNIDDIERQLEALESGITESPEAEKGTEELEKEAEVEDETEKSEEDSGETEETRNEIYELEQLQKELENSGPPVEDTTETETDGTEKEIENDNEEAEKEIETETDSRPLVTKDIEDILSVDNDTQQSATATAESDKQLEDIDSSEGEFEDAEENIKQLESESTEKVMSEGEQISNDAELNENITAEQEERMLEDNDDKAADELTNDMEESGLGETSDWPRIPEPVQQMEEDESSFEPMDVDRDGDAMDVV